MDYKEYSEHTIGSTNILIYHTILTLFDPLSTCLFQNIINIISNKYICKYIGDKKKVLL